MAVEYEIESPTIIPYVGSLAGKTASGFAWTMVQTVGSKAVNFAGQIVLAWWLTTSDFALPAIALAIVTFANLIHEAGLQQVLIHRQREFTLRANGAFWMSVASGLLGMMVMAVLARPAEIYFKAPHLAAMMFILAIRSPFLSLATVPTAQLQNEMRFKLLSILQLVVATVVMGLTIVFAWFLPTDLKALAYVLPLLAGAILRAGVLLIVAPPPIRADFEWHTWRALAGSSAIILLANFFFTISSQGDYLTVGKLQSKFILGIYFFAFNLTLQTTQFLTVNLSAILLPVLSKLQHDSDRQRRAFLRASNVLMMLGVPICLAQAVLAGPMLHVVFGHKWDASIGVLQVISVAMALQLVNTPALGMIQAQGRFKTLLALSIFCAVFFLGMVVLGASSGGGINDNLGIISWPWLKRPLEAMFGERANVAVVVALAVTVYCAIIGPTCIYTAIRPVGGRMSQIGVIYLRPFLMSVAALGVAGAAFAFMPVGRLGDWIKLIGITLLAIALYLPMMRWLAPATWNDLVRQISELFNSSSATVSAPRQKFDAGFISHEYGDKVHKDILRMIPPDGHVIGSIGCGSAATEAVLIHRGIDVHGVDIDPHAIELAKNRITSARVIAPDDFSPYEAGSLDGLILADVLEHIPRAWKALDHYVRCVRPGGWVIISTPNMRNYQMARYFIFQGDWPEDSRGIFDATHVQIMTKRRLARWCRNSGLSIERWYGSYESQPFPWVDWMTFKIFHTWFSYELQVLCRKRGEA